MARRGWFRRRPSVVPYEVPAAPKALPEVVVSRYVHRSLRAIERNDEQEAQMWLKAMFDTSYSLMMRNGLRA